MAMAMASLRSSLTPSSALSSSPSLSPLTSIPASSSSRGLTSQRLRIFAGSDTSRREGIRIRHARIRKKLSGTEERPRLAVFRSNQHIYVQVIDDTKGFTLASASTIQKNLREELQLSSGPTVDAAKRVGAEIAKACLSKGITKVAFDRGGFVYHGRIKAVADAARENGLDF